MKEKKTILSELKSACSFLFSSIFFSPHLPLYHTPVFAMLALSFFSLAHSFHHSHSLLLPPPSPFPCFLCCTGERERNGLCCTSMLLSCLCELRKYCESSAKLYEIVRNAEVCTRKSINLFERLQMSTVEITVVNFHLATEIGKCKIRVEKSFID